MFILRQSTRLSLFVGAALCLAIAPLTVAAAPVIANMPIRGLQIGSTTTISIQGSDLLPNAKLVIGVPIAKQVVLDTSTAKNVKIEVTLDESVTPGIYNLRLANDHGISSSVIVAVDVLPQVAMADRVRSMPVAFHGTLRGSTISRITFQGKADQRLLFEVESQRLGGKLRPVLHLYDARRRQIDWAMSAPWLSGDARLTVSLPADGQYTLEIHDLQYAGPAPGHYRLKIGSFQYVDMVFPPAVQFGQKASLQLVGNVPSDKRVLFTADRDGPSRPAPWPKLTAASGTRPRVIISHLKELVEASSGQGPQALSSVPVAVSGRLNAKGQEDVYRIEVTPGDKLRFEVFADRLGSPIDPVLEIRNGKGGRLGGNDDIAGTADPRLDYTVAKNVKTIDVSIRDQVDRGDERSIYRLVVTSRSKGSNGPSFRLLLLEDTHNVPQGATKVFQVIAQRQGYHGPIRLIFDNLPTSVMANVGVIPAGSNGALVTLEGAGQRRTNLVTSLRGSSVDIDPPITAVASFEKHPLANVQPWMQEEIALALTPPGELPFQIEWSQPNSVTHLVLGQTFQAPLKINRPPGAIGPVRLTLVSSEPRAPLIKGKPDPNQLRAERLVVDIPIDAKAKAALDAVAVAKKDLTSAQANVTVIHQAGATLVADSQAAARRSSTQKQAAAKAATEAAAQRKALEEMQAAAFNAKRDAQAKLDAATRQLAEAEEQIAKADAKLTAANDRLVKATKKHTQDMGQIKTATAAAAKADAESAADLKAAETRRVASEKAFRIAVANINSMATFNVIIPPNLQIGSYDLALKAELRSLDNKTVIAECFTPVRRFSPMNPLALQLAGGPNFVSRIDPKKGASVKISGVIQRKAGFAGDVTLTITGQPSGVAAPKVVVKPDKSNFELKLKFPANFKPSKINSIKIVATGPPNPKKATILVKTELAISVILQTSAP